jgi:hypothetical protein
LLKTDKKRSTDKGNSNKSVAEPCGTSSALAATRKIPSDLWPFISKSLSRRNCITDEERSVKLQLINCGVIGESCDCVFCTQRIGHYLTALCIVDLAHSHVPSALQAPLRTRALWAAHLLVFGVSWVQMSWLSSPLLDDWSRLLLRPNKEEEEEEGDDGKGTAVDGLPFRTCEGDARRNSAWRGLKHGVSLFR